MDGEIRAFHNICRHRGNKLVWTDFPREEASGSCRQFVCKYHGWKYELDGACSFVQQESEFFDFDRADYGLVPVHCDVWAGFVFVNLAAEPSQSLTEFLGPMVTAIDGYPFDAMTERYSYRAVVGANWKLFIDAFQEFYHAPVLHAKQTPAVISVPAQEAGFEGLHYQIDGPHRLVSTYGGQGWRMPSEMLKPMETVTRSGLFGPWDKPDLGIDTMPAGINPAGTKPWGLDSFQVWPNFVILVWERGWYLTYHYWPTSHRRARLRGEPLLRAAEDGSRARRAGDGRGHVQGVRVAGRQHPRGHADDARVEGAHVVPAQRPGDPVPPPAQGGGRLGRRLHARERAGV